MRISIFVCVLHDCVHVCVSVMMMCMYTHEISPKCCSLYLWLVCAGISFAQCCRVYVHAPVLVGVHRVSSWHTPSVRDP
jgi:hypothetical protein